MKNPAIPVITVLVLAGVATWLAFNLGAKGGDDKARTERADHVLAAVPMEAKPVNADLPETYSGPPPGSVLIEAESFEQVSGKWYAAPIRPKCAPGGLSGGSALSSNTPDSVARKTIELPEGDEWIAWARVFDWAGAPGHYQLTLTIDGRSKTMSLTEPIASTFVWERWGTVKGGTQAIEVSRPDGFNSGLDCLLFVRDHGYVPPVGPDAKITERQVDGEIPHEETSIGLRFVPSVKMPDASTVYMAVTKEDRRRGRRHIVWSGEVKLPAPNPEWSPGDAVQVPEFRVPKLDHLWPGRYAVRVGIQNTSLALGEEIVAFTKEASTMPQPVRAEIRPHRGSPTVFIDGEPESPFAYLIHAGDRERHYGQMAKIGVRFFTAGAGIGATSTGFDPAGCDASFLPILRHQPKALIFPRVGVTAPEWWLEAHPEERVKFHDGSVGPQSMFSELWLRDACRWIEEYSRYLRTSPYADHVMGIHICSGVSAEWQSWGLWSDQRGDFSQPALRAWRAYLRSKYATDAALSAAWGRHTTIEKAEIPTRERRETKTGFFRMPAKHQDIIDFYDFYWRGTARAIEALAAAAKRGGGRDWLVGFFYGYAIQFGGKMQESQHLGMRQVMDCPDIDFFSSPCMYSLRQPGGTSTFMSFTESLKLRNKFWFDEADNRTHLAKNNVSPAADMFETLNVLKREFAHAHTRQAGMWWFDMQGGWYDDPQILDLFHQMREFAETGRSNWRPATQVAIFLDDKSSYRLPPESPYLHNLTQLFAELPRLGAPYDTYLQCDLDQAANYRLVILPLAFDLTDGERKAIEALKRDGRTLLFIGQAGIGRYEDGRVVHDPAQPGALLGVTPQGDVWKTVDHGTWRLAWTPNPHPAMSELRDVARKAGIHLYNVSGGDADDALYVGNGMIALHAKTGGSKTLRFSQRLRVRELFASDSAETTRTEISFDLRPTETKCFAVRLP